MNKRLSLVFDLDGTLIDTLIGIKDALNITLYENKIVRSKRYFKKDEVKEFIGRGAKNLLKKALQALNLNLDEDLFLDLYNKYLINYDKYQYNSKPFKDVKESFKDLSKDFDLFIYSNKPDHLLQNLIKVVFKDELKYFKEIKGEDKVNFPLKPNKEYLNDLMKRFNIKRDDLVIIGDSMTDLLLGDNIKSKKIFLMKYGYGNYDEIEKFKDNKRIYLVSSFKRLKELLYDL